MEFCHADSRALRTNWYYPGNSNKTNRKLEHITATNYTQSRVQSWVSVYRLLGEGETYERPILQSLEFTLTSPGSFQVCRKSQNDLFITPDLNVRAYFSASIRVGWGSRHVDSTCENSVAYAAIQKHELGNVLKVSAVRNKRFSYIARLRIMFVYSRRLLFKGGKFSVASAKMNGEKPLLYWCGTEG